MAALPLIRAHAPDGVFAYRNEGPVRAGGFLRDVARVAAMLPDRRYVLNSCADRYRFTVGFAAALTRRQVNLLPPNQTPDLMAQLAGRYPDVYCLAESADESHSLETLVFPPL